MLIIAHLARKVNTLAPVIARICDNYFVPNCMAIGYCMEGKCCGKMPHGLAGLKDKIIEDYKREHGIKEE